MAFLLLMALIIGAGLFALGFFVGRTRASDFDRTRRAQYKEAVADLDAERSNRLESDRKVDVATRALNSILRNDSLAEVTASMALNDMNNNK